MTIIKGETKKKKKKKRKECLIKPAKLHEKGGLHSLKISLNHLLEILIYSGLDSYSR